MVHFKPYFFYKNLIFSPFRKKNLRKSLADFPLRGGGGLIMMMMNRRRAKILDWRKFNNGGEKACCLLEGDLWQKGSKHHKLSLLDLPEVQRMCNT